ncbi:MAG TPA: putative toxin-antitoxin system toxin component, PIN family [Bryobacteraceae bacterium]|nr:putative toxin-antitoxin system toxin component, PIN family [Bryobacteraceae bacterium]
MTRVVFDTNILYSAILKPGSVPAKAFDLVTDGLIIPCVSDDVLAEYRRVLYRPDLNLHGNRRRELLEHLSALSLHVAPTERLALSTDESDNRFLECAETAQAPYLVTGNIRHFPKMHRTTKIVSPRQLLTFIAEREVEEEE